MVLRLLLAACLLGVVAPAYAGDFVLQDPNTSSEFTDGRIHWDERRAAMILGSTQGLATRFPNIRGMLEMITSAGDARYTALAFGTGRAILQLARARGTQASPQSVVLGDELGSITWDGFQDDLCLQNVTPCPGPTGLFVGAARLRVVSTAVHGTRWGLPGEFQFQLSTTGSAFNNIAKLRGWQDIPINETSLDLAVRTPSSAVLKRVQIGAPDSCGSGKRCLTIDN